MKLGDLRSSKVIYCDGILEIMVPLPEHEYIYARNGVSEVWRYERKQLRIYQLINKTYVETEASLAFPNFPVKSIPDFIKQNINKGRRLLRQSFRAWARQILTAGHCC